MAAKDNLVNYIDSVYSSALYLVKDSDEADDLVQEVYLKAFRFLDNKKEIEYEKAWLFKILMNTFINKYRKDKSEPSLVDFDTVEMFHESIEEEAFTSPITGNEAKFGESLDSDVKKALDSLPDDFRSVILLSTVEGFTYNEISEMLGCPIGTVMSRIYRGKKYLKDKLASYAKEIGYGRGVK
ncbi:MAG: sigma-70 family RNA polymerase sigma factor [Candidatus Anammoxibacter sp.]